MKIFDVRDPAAVRALPSVVGAGGLVGLHGSRLFTGHIGTAEVWDLGAVDADAVPRRVAIAAIPSHNVPAMSRQDVLTSGGRLMMETDEQGLWQFDAVPRPAGRAWLPALAR